MAERKNKEYKLESDNSFRIKYGSMDKDNPKVVYINGDTWMIPPKIEGIKSSIPSIERNVRNFVKYQVNTNDMLDKSFIFDFDLKPDSIVPGRKKFISFELFVRQKRTDSLLSIKENIRDIASKISWKIENELTSNEFKPDTTK